jgi:hypothetical protein
MNLYGNPLDYVLLQDASDDSSTLSQVNAFLKAEEWPGFPYHAIQPNSIPVNPSKFFGTVVPIPPLQGRKTKRGQGYAGLSNYNFIP